MFVGLLLGYVDRRENVRTICCKKELMDCITLLEKRGRKKEDKLNESFAGKEKGEKWNGRKREEKEKEKGQKKNKRNVEKIENIEKKN